MTLSLPLAGTTPVTEYLHRHQTHQSKGLSFELGKGFSLSEKIVQTIHMTSTGWNR